MAATQLPIDLKVLRVIAYRYKWLLVTLTFLSFAFSAVITKSMIALYSASVTIFVDPENVLGDIAQGVAVSTSLRDQLDTIRHRVLSDDFIESHVIQDLNIRLQDVYIPPLGLDFMPALLDLGDTLKQTVKKLVGFEIYELDEQQQQYMQQQQIVQIIKKHIILQHSRGTLLMIEYTGPNITASRKIVEILANQCKELLLRSKNQETREALRYIQRQYTEANQQLEELERQLADMKVEQFDKGPSAKIALLQQRQEAQDSLRVMRKQLDELQLRKNELIEDQNARRESLLNDPEIVEQLYAVARSQEAQILQAKRKRLNELLSVYTDQWPEVIKLQQEVAELEQTIQEDIEESDDAERDKILLADPIYNEYFRQMNQIEAEEASLRKTIATVEENIQVYEEKLRGMPEFEKSFGAVQRQIDLYSDLQVELASKLQTADATMELEKMRGENRIRIVGRSFPTQPTGVSPILIMAFLSILGPGFGGGIVFLLYYLNTSVQGPEDVRVEYNLPVIAVIPNTNFKKALKAHKKLLKKSEAQEDIESALGGTEHLAVQDIKHPEIELFNQTLKCVPAPMLRQSEEFMMVTLLTNPESQAAEEYRRLCFNVEWDLKEALTGLCKTIMVTSALPGEGKSITAINLASTLARNHPVLLVDANFRKPSVHKAFGIPPGQGLSDMIKDRIVPQLYVPQTSPNLSILPAGLALGHPADLLSSNEMSAFIESVKSSQHFDFAIFDVPPSSLIPDASIIASKLDGIVWVILELRTGKDVVRQALTRITNPALLGVVLNRSEQRMLPKKYDKVWRDYQRGAVDRSRKKKGRKKTGRKKT